MRNVIIPIILLTLNLYPFCLGQAEEEAKQEVNDFSFVQYKDGGAEKWKLNGRSAEVKDDTVNIEDISAVIYGETTGVKLRAKEGSFDKEENLVHFKNNVVAATTNGTKLTTDSLDWNTESKNVSTDAAVNIKRADLEATGNGAICDLDGQTAELKQDIKTTIASSSDPDAFGTRHIQSQTAITCDGPLVLNYKKNRASFHNNVKVEDISGNILADRMDVYFNPGTRRIKCVVARGNVRIINGENITYSDRAIYLVEQARVVLPNRPKLIINNDAVR